MCRITEAASTYTVGVGLPPIFTVYNATMVSSWTRSYSSEHDTTIWTSSLGSIGYIDGVTYSPIITTGSGLEMRVIHDREYKTAKNTATQAVGESIFYRFDFSRLMAETSTSVSSVEWSVKGGQATLSGEVLDTNKADAIITTTQEGISHIQLTATLADSTTRVKNLMINSICPPNFSDSY